MKKSHEVNIAEVYCDGVCAFVDVASHQRDQREEANGEADQEVDSSAGREERRVDDRARTTQCVGQRTATHRRDERSVYRTQYIHVVH